MTVIHLIEFVWTMLRLTALLLLFLDGAYYGVLGLICLLSLHTE